MGLFWKVLAFIGVTSLVGAITLEEAQKGKFGPAAKNVVNDFLTGFNQGFAETYYEKENLHAEAEEVKC